MKHILILILAITSLFSFHLSATPVIHAEKVETIAGSLLLRSHPVDPASCDIEIDRAAELARRITDYASQFLGRKYVWGATGPRNFDCSGFTSYVFRNTGIELPRTSRAQYTQGRSVDRADLRPGDLMFFSSPRSGRGRVGHVAIVVDVDQTDNSLTFIHASSGRGITYQRFPDGGYYSRNYIGAKRIIDAGATLPTA